MVTLDDIAEEGKKLGEISGLARQASDPSQRLTHGIVGGYIAYMEKYHNQPPGIRESLLEDTEMRVGDQIGKTATIQQQRTCDAVKDFGYSTLLNGITEKDKLVTLAMSAKPKKTNGRTEYNKTADAIEELRRIQTAISNGDYTPYYESIKDKEARAVVERFGESHRESFKKIVHYYLARRQNEVLGKFAEKKEGELDIQKLRAYLTTTEKNSDKNERVGLYVTAAQVYAQKKE